MTIDFINVWSKVPNTLNGVKNGDPLAYLRLASEINTYKYTMQYAKSGAEGVRNFSSMVNTQGFQGATNTALTTARTSLVSGWSSANNINMFRGIPFEKVHNAIPQSLRFLNGSLLETSVGKGIVSKLGGSVTFAQGASSFGQTATVTGSTAGRVAGKTLARIPLIGILISTAFEVPDLIDAYKNGDFGAQVGRSTLNVACTTAGAAIGAAIGSAVPVVGTIIGGFIGGLIGSAVGKGLGKMLFGKSIKDKMRDGDKTRDIIKTYNNLNFGNVGTGRSIYDKPAYNYTGYTSNNVNTGTTNIDVDRLINSINQGMAKYN